MEPSGAVAAVAVRSGRPASTVSGNGDSNVASGRKNVFSGGSNGTTGASSPGNGEQAELHRVMRYITTLKDEEDGLNRLTAVREGWDLVAQALGPTRFRNEFLPYVLAEPPIPVDEEEDVSLAILDKLLSSVEYCGGSKFVTHLSAVAAEFAGVADHHVGTRAVEVMIALFRGCPASQLKEAFGQVAALKESENMYQSAAAAVLIPPLLLVLFEPSPSLYTDTMSMFFDLCTSERGLVRRFALANTPSLCEAVGRCEGAPFHHSFVDKVTAILAHTVTDPESGCRIAAVQSAVTLLSAAAAEMLGQRMYFAMWQLLTKLSEDEHWFVRYTLVRNLAALTQAALCAPSAFCSSTSGPFVSLLTSTSTYAADQNSSRLANLASSPEGAQMSLLTWNLQKLQAALTDVESEVRYAALTVLPDVVRVRKEFSASASTSAGQGAGRLRGGWTETDQIEFCQSLSGPLQTIRRSAVSCRAGLAETLLKCAAFFADSVIQDHLKPILIDLLRDPEVEVQEATLTALIANERGTLLKITTFADVVVQVLDSLFKSPGWRIRHGAIAVTPAILCRLANESDARHRIAALLVDGLSDPVHAIRMAVAGVLPAALKIMGASWHSSVLLPKLKELRKHPAYSYRMVVVVVVKMLLTEECITPAVLKLLEKRTATSVSNRSDGGAFLGRSTSSAPQARNAVLKPLSVVSMSSMTTAATASPRVQELAESANSCILLESTSAHPLPQKHSAKDVQPTDVEGAEARAIHMGSGRSSALVGPSVPAAVLPSTEMLCAVSAFTLNKTELKELCDLFKKLSGDPIANVRHKCAATGNEILAFFKMINSSCPQSPHRELYLKMGERLKKTLSQLCQDTDKDVRSSAQEALKCT